MMEEKYISNKEYNEYYERLSNLRSIIAHDLPVASNMRIVDIATGYAYFAIEVAEHAPSLSITGIDISLQDVLRAHENIKQSGLLNRMRIVSMDATRMAFHERAFDMAINFIGLEDIHMTRGKRGIQEAFLEVNRVLKPDAYFCFVVMPVDEMETKAQKTEVALYSYICNATWLKRLEYIKMLEKAGFILIREKRYRTGKKLTSEQARHEIRYACDNVPKIYGIVTPSFEDVWNKFGNAIEENGVGQISKVLLMITHKREEMGHDVP